MTTVEAFNLAMIFHHSQVRDYNDEPYVNHLKRVGDGVQVAGLSDDAVIAAYLHDSIEDVPSVTPDLLRDLGVPERAIDLVMILSKPPLLPRLSSLSPYFAAIAADPDARIIKVIDRTDNILDFRAACLAKQFGARPRSRTYARETRKYFFPWVVTEVPKAIRFAFLAALHSLEEVLG